MKVTLGRIGANTQRAGQRADLFFALNTSDAFAGKEDGDKHADLFGVSICAMTKSKIRSREQMRPFEYENVSINHRKLALVCGWDLK